MSALRLGPAVMKQVEPQLGLRPTVDKPSRQKRLLSLTHSLRLAVQVRNDFRLGKESVQWALLLLLLARSIIRL
jgi:hypothetical protein